MSNELTPTPPTPDEGTEDVTPAIAKAFGQYLYGQAMKQAAELQAELYPGGTVERGGGPGSPECIAACIVKSLTASDVVTASLQLAAAQYADQLAADAKALACSVS